MLHRPTKTRALAYIALAGLAWGTGGPTGALLFQSSGLTSTAISFWRLATGAAWLLLANCLFTRAPIRATFMAAPRRYILTGLGLTACQVGYFAAIPRVGVAVATVVSLGAGPLFIALATRERITPALLLAVLGLTLLVAAPGTAITTSIPGILLSLLSAAGYAMTTVLNRNHAVPTITALLGFTTAALTLLPFALLEGLTPHPASWPTLAYFGLIPTALAYTLFYASLRTLTPSTAAVLALLEPLTATALAVLLFHEHPTPLTLLGAATLLTAVALKALRP